MNKINWVEKQDGQVEDNPINNPKHYMVIDDYEAIDIIKELLGLEHFISYCYGNVLKYSLRAKKKDNFVQDINKAKEYIKFMNRAIENEG